MPRSCSTRSRHTFRPRLDPLEGRLLLAAGDLDPTFGAGGLATTSFSSAGKRPAQLDAVATAVRTQVVGGLEKIVAAGYASGSVGLARYNPDGTLDTTFGTGGRVTTSFSGATLETFDMVIQPDGKIIVVGEWKGTSRNREYWDFAVVRYNPNGTLDTTFGPNRTGLVTTDLGGFGEERSRAVVLQPDGKILVAGHVSKPSGTTDYDFALVRYHTNGVIDTSFGSGGVVTTDFNTGGFDYLNGLALGTVLEADGRSSTKIVAVGHIAGVTPVRAALARYNLDGSLDLTFSGDGKVVTDFGVTTLFNDVTFQPDGKILAAGRIAGTDGTSDLAVFRYDTAGNLDPSFGPYSNGIATSNRPGPDSGVCIVLQPDGKALVGGYASPDSSADSRHTALARFNADGRADTNFGVGGFAVHNLGADAWAVGLTLQSDGRIVTAGGVGAYPNIRSFVVARFLGDSGTAVVAASAAAPITTTGATTAASEWARVEGVATLPSVPPAGPLDLLPRSARRRRADSIRLMSILG